MPEMVRYTVRLYFTCRGRINHHWKFWIFIPTQWYSKKDTYFTSGENCKRIRFSQGTGAFCWRQCQKDRAFGLFAGSGTLKSDWLGQVYCGRGRQSGDGCVDLFPPWGSPTDGAICGQHSYGNIDMEFENPMNTALARIRTAEDCCKSLGMTMAE